MKTRIGYLLLVPALLLVATLAGTGAAAAHNSGPARSEQIQVGGYRFTIDTYAWPPHVAEPVAVTLLLIDPPGVPSSAYRVDATAVPPPGLDEAPLAITVRPDPDDPRRLSLDPTIPAKGDWVLRLQVSGPRGEGATSVPWSVEGPPAIPPWLGWAIGLIPLWGFLVFAGGEYRRFRRIPPDPFPAPEKGSRSFTTNIPAKDP